MNLRYTGKNLPIVLEKEDFDYINKLNKNWKYHQAGLISCLHTHDDKTKEIFMHNIIMALKDRGDMKDNPVVHINKIGLDNRRENIIYDTQNKNFKKNLKKKKRTIKLPEDSGIEPDEIPTYVWYLKENGSHGDRFAVEIGNLKWKTTSSKKMSLRYKLEQAKKYLRDLKNNKPEYFYDFSMNGDLTKKGEDLLKSYKLIVKKAGYLNIDYIPAFKKFNIENLTDKYLEDHSYKINSSFEKNLLLENKEEQKRSSINKLKLPKYVYFKSEYKNRGAYFYVDKHPKQDSSWQSTSSKKVSLAEKYKELVRYLKKLNS
ncbi:MAG: hypothetical protein CMF62_00205 [Magnetococcales bacterium]|nr:hypothetical protein [Magnetococcales bacterium]